jgi:small subunit ribosomal protein S1
VSEIADEHVDDPRKYLKVGDEKEVMIIDIDLDDRKIGLSIKAVGKAEAGVDYRAYLNTAGGGGAGNSSSSSSMGTLADALKGKLKRD